MLYERSGQTPIIPHRPVTGDACDPGCALARYRSRVVPTGPRQPMAGPGSGPALPEGMAHVERCVSGKPGQAGISRVSQGAHREPTLLQALTPLLFLVLALACAVYLYRDDASFGANQIGLMLATGVAGLVGLRNRIPWEEIQESLVHGVALAVVPIFILLSVGALIGTWILSGTVPVLIVYGMELMHPSYFYPAACLICAIVALSIGSSWTVAGTLGVALIGVAQGMDMSLPITAGAVISGAYFGDKMSPISDTTIIAPAAAGAELF